MAAEFKTEIQNPQYENDYMSQTPIYEEAHFTNASKAFLNGVCMIFKDSQLNDNQMFNTNQSGFNIETRLRRMLDLFGCKQIERVTQSIHATTHSYTINDSNQKKCNTAIAFICVF